MTVACLMRQPRLSRISRLSRFVSSSRILWLMRLLLIIFISILLSSCITLPADQGALHQNVSWPTRVKHIEKIQAWQLYGAIAIKTSQAGQAASFNWQQQANQHYTIGLYGPLGAGRVTLIGTPNQVSLTANGKQYHAKTPESLMQDVLGWQLPVHNLYYWIRGIPAPNLPATRQFDAANRLSKLEQQGWQVTYLQYTGVNGVDLPTKIMLKNQQLSVKVVLSSWQLTPSS